MIEPSSRWNNKNSTSHSKKPTWQWQTLLLLFLFSFCSPLQPDTNMACICTLRTELVISPEWLHLFSDLHKLHRWLLAYNRHKMSLHLGSSCQFLRSRITSLQNTCIKMKFHGKRKTIVLLLCHTTESTLDLRARLGKTTNLALYVFSLWTLVWRPSKERFLRRWSTAIPIVGASFFGIPAAWWRKKKWVIHHTILIKISTQIWKY